MARTKVCLVASCGGHIMELMQLFPAVEGKDYYFVVEKNVVTEGILQNHKHYYLKQQQRRGIFRFACTFAWNIFLSFIYFLLERPTTVITTGAGASYPMCRIAKIFGRKVIYIESFAKLNNASETGRRVYLFADEFFVQWPEMKTVYPKAKYAGTVY